MSGRQIISGVAALALGGLLGFTAGRYPNPPEHLQSRVESQQSDKKLIARDDQLERFLARSPAHSEPGAELMLHAIRDPRGALAQLEALADRDGASGCREFYKALFRAWALRDMEGALAALDRIEAGPAWAAADEVLNVLFEQDPQRAADLMNAGRYPSSLPRWLMENPIDACKLVPKIASSQDGADHFSFTIAWATRDPEAALEWAKSLTGWQRSKAMGEVVWPWVQRDLQGAIAALDSGRIEEPKLRQSFEQQIARELGKSQPQQAIERISRAQSVSDRDRRRTVESIVKGWASRDPAAVIDWTRSQDSARYRELGLQAVGKTWAEDDPAAAAEFTVSSDARLLAIPDLAEAIGKNYLKQDVGAALDWVDQLSPGARAPTEAILFEELFHRDRQLALSHFNTRLQRLSPPAVERISAEYFKTDLASALRWIESLPQGLAFDSARAGIEIAATESGDAALAQIARNLAQRR